MSLLQNTKNKATFSKKKNYTQLLIMLKHFKASDTGRVISFFPTEYGGVFFGFVGFIWDHSQSEDRGRKIASSFRSLRNHSQRIKITSIRNIE